MKKYSLPVQCVQLEELAIQTEGIFLNYAVNVIHFWFGAYVECGTSRVNFKTTLNKLQMNMVVSGQHESC